MGSLSVLMLIVLCFVFFYVKMNRESRRGALLGLRIPASLTLRSRYVFSGIDNLQILIILSRLCDVEAVSC